MKNYFKKVWTENQTIRKTVGVILVIVGLLSIVTPFTPVGFLLLLGLEILGVRYLLWDKFKNWLQNIK